MGRYSLALTSLGALLFAGCSGGPATSTKSPGSCIGAAAPRPLPPEYRTLAENLSLDKSSPDQYRDDKSITKIPAEGPQG